MAVLSATIRLRDQFTSAMSRVQRSTGQFNNSLRNTEGAISKTIAKAKVLGHMVIRPTVKVADYATRPIRAITSSLMSLKGLATMALAGMGINELGRATIGEAAQSELSLITMGAILKSEKMAKEYFEWLSKEANKTSFDDQEMLTAGTALAPYAKSTAMFQKYIRMAEVLSAINPAEGLEGATFALREALSGDFVSLQERFNLPRSVINDLKEGKTTAEEFYEVVEKAAAAQGFTYELVEKQAKSSIGLWRTITGTIATFFRKSGEGILDSLKPRLEQITTWFDNHPRTVSRWKDNLVTFGRQASEGLLSSLEGAFTHIRVTYLDNPEFQKLDFTGKVNFIMGDVGAAISSWLDSGGSDTLREFGTKIGDFIGQGLMSVAPGIGRAAGTAVISAFASALQSSFLGSVIIGALGGAGIGAAGGVVFGGVGAVPGAVMGGVAGAGAGAITWGADKIYSRVKGKALGMPYVPYDNYPAMLHKGETVLTRAESDQYRKGGGDVAIAKLADTIVVREEADIKKIANAVADEIVKVSFNMPNPAL